MLDILWPWVLVLAPVPLLYRWYRRPINLTASALVAPALASIAEDHRGPTERLNWRRLILRMLLTLCWLATLLALSRPVWIGEPVALPTSGRDLLLAVDISGSMEQEDMLIGGSTVNRLGAVKTVVGEFVAQRRGDRLGLILFGERAYLQTPLTFDTKTMQILLEEAQIGFAGRRVIEETVREKLPEDFQTAEYLMDHGMVDAVVARSEQAAYFGKILDFLMGSKGSAKAA